MPDLHIGRCGEGLAEGFCRGLGLGLLAPGAFLAPLGFRGLFLDGLFGRRGFPFAGLVLPALPVFPLFSGWLGRGRKVLGFVLPFLERAMKRLTIPGPDQAGSEIVVMGEGEFLGVIVDCLLTTGLGRIAEIAEGEEGMGDVFLVPKFHLPCCGKVVGVLAPEKSGIVLIADVQGPQVSLVGIEDLQRVADTRGIHDQGD